MSKGSKARQAQLSEQQKLDAAFRKINGAKIAKSRRSASDAYAKIAAKVKADTAVQS